MKEVIVRTLSGVIYISIVLFTLFTSRELFLVLFAVLALLTLYEFMKLINLTSYVAYGILAVAFYFFSYDLIDPYALSILLLGCLFVNLFLMKDLFSFGRIPMFLNKKYIVVIFYLIAGFVFLTLIPFIGNVFTPKVIVGIFVLVWANDTLAYIIGKNFGKRKLFERISPKKTVEGFLGGLAASICVSFAIFKVTETYTMFIWLGLAVVVSVGGTFGDLIQSKFKRQAQVKDSGRIMPGHGGLYDRLDSVIYASPFVYAFLQIIAYVS
ncbi:MAG: phosphatidate cytidylyltransferase [Flavobacteriaceae bacterium]|nr:phosphatidate cytidylyltransferase [Flavobacteriaceae bacterium]